MKPSMHHQVIRQTNARPTRGAWQRREFLRWIPAAAATTGLLGWTDLVAAQSGELRKRGKRCILLWMKGGPSQFETFSPLVQHDNSGETKAIETATSGIQIASTLPETAKVMDDICVIRSMTSKEGSHPRASFLMQTGYLPNPSARHPSFGSITAQQLGDAAAELPSFVRLGSRFGRGSVGAGLLGVDYDPFVMSDPKKPPQNSRPRTSEKRFQRRLALTRKMNQGYGRITGRNEADDHTKLYNKASSMMLSPEMRAFNVSEEPQAMQDAYGTGDFASGCLLARRLLEAGVTFVEVALGNWDTHQDVFSRTTQLCGQLDQPYAQLLRDLKARGMLDDTLIIWMGEFGRTPRINGRGGRDHFPKAFSVALAGGGVRGGQVIGATDKSGNEVTDRPVSVQDLFQTFCHLLQIDPDFENMGNAGRPIKIVEGGEPVSEVWS